MDAYSLAVSLESIDSEWLGNAVVGLLIVAFLAQTGVMIAGHFRQKPSMETQVAVLTKRSDDHECQISELHKQTAHVIVLAESLREAINHLNANQDRLYRRLERLVEASRQNWLQASALTSRVATTDADAPPADPS